MIQNQILYTQKISCLSKFKKQYQATYSFIIDFTLHEIAFRLHTNDSKITELLKILIPSNWLKSSSSPIDIYHNVPASYKIDSIAWTSETSQDCIFDNDNILQRDFAAKRLGDISYLLICDSIDSDPLHNFFRMLLPKCLLQKKSYIIHSSCVLSKNQEHAYLFLGHSGFGKTTITSLSTPRKILSDDMNIISMKDLKVSAAALGHQFHTLDSYDKQYKIKKIFWLNKSQENSITSLKKSTASLKLLSSITNLFWENIDQNIIEKIILDVDIISSSIPFFNLHFKKDSEIWNLID